MADEGVGGDPMDALDDTEDAASTGDTREGPPERVDGGDGGATVDTYDVTTWEPRTVLDRLSLGIWRGVLLATNAVLIVVGLVILGAQAVLVGLGVVLNPVVAAFTAISLVPALAIALDLGRLGVDLRKTAWLLAGTFLLSATFAGFALIPNTLLRHEFVDVPVVGIAAFFFLVVGPVEEFVKMLAVRVYGYRSAAMSTACHGAVVGAFAGLGFATTENGLYIASQFLGGFGLVEISITRAVAGPGHVLFSAIAGYYLGLAKTNREFRGAIATKGLLIAAFLHGSYNTLVSVLADLPEWVPRIRAPIVVEGQAWFAIGLALFYLLVGIYVFRKLLRFRRTTDVADIVADERRS